MPLPWVLGSDTVRLELRVQQYAKIGRPSCQSSEHEQPSEMNKLVTLAVADIKPAAPMGAVEITA